MSDIMSLYSRRRVKTLTSELRFGNDSRFLSFNKIIWGIPPKSRKAPPLIRSPPSPLRSSPLPPQAQNRILTYETFRQYSWNMYLSKYVKKNPFFEKVFWPLEKVSGKMAAGKKIEGWKASLPPTVLSC